MSNRAQAIRNAKSRQSGWLVGDIAPRKVSLERRESLDVWSNKVGIDLVRHERKAYSCSNLVMVSINQCSRLHATCVWILASRENQLRTAIAIGQLSSRLDVVCIVAIGSSINHQAILLSLVACVDGDGSL